MAEAGGGRPDPGRSWLERWLRLCLLSWPRAARRARGHELVETARRLVAESPGGPWRRRWEALAEGWALVRAGTGLRFGSQVGRGGARAWTRPMGWVADVRQAWRGLARNRGFTALVALTLALGIGANAVVFGLVDRVLLRAPPYEDPDDLVLIWNTLPDSPDRIPVPGPDVAVLRERARSLASIAFVGRVLDGSLTGGADEATRHVRLSAVTPDLFDVLGVEAALGRTFEDPDGAPPGEGASASALVLSHALWTDAFGADPGIVGRTARVNGVAGVVVGVLPARFELELPPDAGIEAGVDVWVPLRIALADFHRTEGRLLDRDSDNAGAVVARLTAGATPADARADLARIASDLRAQVPAYREAGLGLDARPLHADATEHARGVLLALLVGVGVVLLVACLNVATLLLARGLARRDELAVRQALGADRGRIVRQLAAEALLLVGLGLGLGLLLVELSAPALTRLIPSGLSGAGVVGVDLRVAGFAALLAGGSALVFGLAPAFQAAAREARGALGPGLGARGVASGGRLRSGLVVAEVALSVVLVLAAGLLLRTVTTLRAVHPGFEAAGALTFHVSPRVPDRYRGPAERARLMNDIERSVADLPGVASVGLVGALPFSGDRWTQPWGLPGQPPSEWRANRADFRVASSGYFEAIGARVLEGRGFTPREDLAEDERVVVVDELMARRIAPGGTAVGATIGLPVDGAPVEARVVGVVEHVRHESLERDGRETVYVPYRQEASRDVAFVVRVTGSPPEALAPAVREAVARVDDRIPVYAVRSLADYLDETLAPRRFALLLLGAFSGLALLCACIGLYGVVALDVGRRTRDIGLRMAVGASRARVLRGVLGRGLRLAGSGLLLGAALAVPAAGAVRGLVHGVGVADLPTWAGVIGVVLAITLVACGIPALRASRLDPTAALRLE